MLFHLSMFACIFSQVDFRYIQNENFTILLRDRWKSVYYFFFVRKIFLLSFCASSKDKTNCIPTNINRQDICSIINRFRYTLSVMVFRQCECDERKESVRECATPLVFLLMNWPTNQNVMAPNFKSMQTIYSLFTY